MPEPIPRRDTPVPREERRAHKASTPRDRCGASKTVNATTTTPSANGDVTAKPPSTAALATTKTASIRTDEHALHAPSRNENATKPHR